MENMGILRPEYHMFLNHGITRHDPDVLGSIMAQLSLKASLNRWGNKGRDAIHSETKKLHMKYTFLPLHWKNISNEQRKHTLEYNMFLKEKRYLTIKVRTVEGRNKQIYFISKEYARLPTVTT